ncbi:winged helix-turn-helix transcriptional regulator [Arthrobacter gandavensis]|uniref:ArsR/SmtB family transcription factor n=1 Tax=Arthrobacter gandavensis TaxID=169960 RepID=UPI00188FCF32|nr:metalloregulator ArsR/SmtB family transcription factor [Arthrobacter gandavensis]MBF4994096.1 winged helix-turn-helix transcriptional regulator [Arthrobacter gandavensis]
MVIDDVFAVIAEGTRREILGALRCGDKSVGTLVQELEVSQPTVSKHLKVLREAGLVDMRAEGQRRYYSLKTGPLDEVVLWLSAFDLPSLTAAQATTPRLAGVAAGLSSDARGRSLFAGLPGTTRQTTAAAAAAEMPSGAAETPSAAVDARVQQQLGRTVGRAAERAADLLGALPKFRRRRP